MKYIIRFATIIIQKSSRFINDDYCNEKKYTVYLHFVNWNPIIDCITYILLHIRKENNS